MTEANDQELQKRFQALKEGDQRQVPAFRSMWSVPVTAGPSSRWMLATAATCSVILVFGAFTFVSLARRDAGRSPAAHPLVADRGPLDFLLDPSRPTSSLPLPAAAGSGFLE